MTCSIKPCTHRSIEFKDIPSLEGSSTVWTIWKRTVFSRLSRLPIKHVSTWMILKLWFVCLLRLSRCNLVVCLYMGVSSTKCPYLQIRLCLYEFVDHHNSNFDLATTCTLLCSRREIQIFVISPTPTFFSLCFCNSKCFSLLKSILRKKVFNSNHLPTYPSSIIFIL